MPNQKYTQLCPLVSIFLNPKQYILTGIIQKIKGNGKFYKNPEMALNKDSKSNHQFILVYFAYLCGSEREKK